MPLAIATDENGFTLVELMVAVLVLTIGTMALLGSFDSSRTLATSAEKHATAQQIAQQEMARVTAQSWQQMALSGTPAKNTGATPADPTYYLSSGSCGSSMTPVSTPCYQWDWTNSANVEPLAIDTTNGTDSPSATPWTTNVSTTTSHTRLTGSIYRFITWVKDPGCFAAACGGTNGANDYKRVTVAVTVTGVPKPVWLSTFVQNPVGGLKNPLTNAGTTCLDGATSVPCTN